MSIEAMKQALEALEECRRDPRLKYEHPFYDKTITSLRTAISEADKQEPVAWANINKHGDITHTNNKRMPWSKTPLYTAPPAAKRQWVGLTDEDKQTAVWTNGTFGAGALWAEAKLREKNNG